MPTLLAGPGGMPLGLGLNEGLGVSARQGREGNLWAGNMMSEKLLRVATFAALVIVMLANVAAGFANWRAYADRRQTQQMLAEWGRQADALSARIDALEAGEPARQPQQRQPLR